MGSAVGAQAVRVISKELQQDLVTLQFYVCSLSGQCFSAVSRFVPSADQWGEMPRKKDESGGILCL